jgi:hypothetical protein
MDKYIEAEKELAELLGHKNIRPFPMRVSKGRKEEEITFLMADGGGDKLSGKNLPRWCRDWSACGPLMVKHGISVEPPTDDYQGWTYLPGLSWKIKANDHPDRDTAVRYAIVQTVIKKLTTQQ